jgi:hypothetical protein
MQSDANEHITGLKNRVMLYGNIFDLKNNELCWIDTAQEELEHECGICQANEHNAENIGGFLPFCMPEINCKSKH